MIVKSTVPVGNKRLEKAAHTFADLLKQGALKEDIEARFMNQLRRRR